MSSIDHLGISASDYAGAVHFYEQALAPLGISKMMQFDHERGSVAGFGKDKPDFWVSTGPGRQRVHLAFAATTRAEVNAFYAAAIAAGGMDNGGPGLRPEYHPHYFAAFVHDADGNNLEAVCHAPE